jgi:hypothetical protein
MGSRPPARTVRTATDGSDRFPILVGVVVLGDQGDAVEVVAPFASEPAAVAWTELHGVERYRVLPARLPGVANPR